MKRWYGYLLGCTLLLSCSKNEQEMPPADTACQIRKDIPVTAHLLDATALQTVRQLFSTNSVSTTGLRFYKYQRESINTAFPPFATIDQQLVRADQYTNGKRIFTGALVYIFQDGKFVRISGPVTAGTSLDTIPQRTVQQLNSLFLESAEKFEKLGAFYKDSCLKMEFGYFDLNVGISFSTENLVKAWRVTLKNAVYLSEFPEAYYEDKDGKLIYYSNGIRSFK